MQDHSLPLSPDVVLSYVGPDLSLGPLPAFFYLSLSAKESLYTDPYNQPVAHLSSLPLRIFSIDLPAHGNGLPPTQALHAWAQEIVAGHNIVHEFTDKLFFAIRELLAKGILQKERIGIAGLSRGAFLALHAAAKIKEINSLLGFAPLTRLNDAKEFQSLGENNLVADLNAHHLIDSLLGRPLRFYIGNRDLRVSTTHCFHFISSLAEASFQKKIRSPQVELIIGPSIGHQGHGTSQEVFHQGSEWMARQLGVSDA